MRLSVIGGVAYHEKCLDVVHTFHDFELGFNFHFFQSLVEGLPALKKVASKIFAMPFSFRRVWFSNICERKPFHLTTEDLVS